MKTTDEKIINEKLIGRTIVRAKMDYTGCKFWFDDGSHLLIEGTGFEGVDVVYWDHSK